MSDVIAAPPQPRVPVHGTDQTFPVHRIYCVGRNFADHAREMGAAVPASQADRGTPVFFLKPADAIALQSEVPYPPGTQDLHHEVELVVALGKDAPAGVLDPNDAMALVYGYAVGLDLTRRDLQGAAKAKGLPWDTGKAFDHAAPISAIVTINGETRQRGSLADLIWTVPDILHELSRLYALRAGDLIFMGTPAGVGPLQPGDRFHAVLEGIAEHSGTIVTGRTV